MSFINADAFVNEDADDFAITTRAADDGRARMTLFHWSASPVFGRSLMWAPFMGCYWPPWRFLYYLACSDFVDAWATYLILRIVT